MENPHSYLEQVTAQRRIEWAIDTYGVEGIVTTTSGGEKSMLLPHLLHRVLGQSPIIIFVDTGYYLRPTLKAIEEMKNQGYDVRIFSSLVSQKEIEERYPLWYKDPESEVFSEVLGIIKHEPLNRAFHELSPSVWIRGLCRYQSVARSHTPVLKNVNGLYHLHPIVDWSRQQVEDYLNKHKLTRNLDHFDITKGLDQKRECGIGESYTIRYE